jgi:hypothetical protein
MNGQSAQLTSDLRVNMVMVDGNLGIQVQIKGIQVFRVVLLDALRDIPKRELERYARLAPDLDFHVGNCLDRIEATTPQ